MELTTAYLAKYPSVSFTLRNLGQRLEEFLREQPHWIAPHEELAFDMTRFEWAQVVAFDDAALPGITTDAILDTPRSKLRLGLQPYLSLLELNYAVDKFLVAVQKRDADVLRDEASNTFEAMPQAKRRRKPVRLPKRDTSTWPSTATTTLFIISALSPRGSPFSKLYGVERQWKKHAWMRSRTRRERG